MDEDHDLADMTGLQREVSFSCHEDPKNATSSVKFTYPQLSPYEKHIPCSVTPRGQSVNYMYKPKTLKPSILEPDTTEFGTFGPLQKCQE